MATFPVFNLRIRDSGGSTNIASVRDIVLSNISLTDNGSGIATLTGPTTSPGGSGGQIQYNNGGSFGGTSALIYSSSGTHLTVTAQAAATKGLIVKGATSQTANLTEWQDSSGNILARIGPRISQSDATLLEINPAKQLIQGDNLKVWGYQSSFVTFAQSHENNANNSGLESPKLRWEGVWKDGAGVVTRPTAELVLTPTYNGGGYLTLSISNSEGLRVWRHENRAPIVGINSALTTAQLNVEPNWTGKVGILVRGVASQTANLQEWQNSAGTVQSFFNSSGLLTVGNATIFSTAHKLNVANSILVVGTGGAAPMCQMWNQASVSRAISFGMNVPGGSLTDDFIFSTFGGSFWSESFRCVNNGAVRMNKHLERSVQTAITASTTQSQGQGALTKDQNYVSTVANANDVITLPSAVAGMEVYVRNGGANTLQIFPASGDAIDGGSVDASVTLAAGASVTYHASDTINWFS